MIKVVFEGLPELRRILKKYAPEVAKELTQRFRGIAKGIADDAKSRASWSKRIPRAISPTVTGKAIGVRVSKKKAPHGGLYERGNKGNSGSIRHPLFGNTAFWFSTPIRPFLEPAVEANRDEATEAARRAVDDARRKVGLRP